jgi:hypothetical protein
MIMTGLLINESAVGAVHDRPGGDPAPLIVSLERIDYNGCWI